MRKEKEGQRESKRKESKTWQWRIKRRGRGGAQGSLVPHPLQGEDLVTMERFLGCAELALLFSSNPIRLLLYIVVLTMDYHLT